MVLARDLKEKIQNMQIQIEGSKRVASIEQELEGVKDAMELFISKFNQAQKEEKDIEEEGQALVEEHEEQEREDEEEEEEKDEEEDEEDEEEEDDDTEQDFEDTEQTPPQVDIDLDKIHVSEQNLVNMKDIKGYNSVKEKIIADTIKAHKRDKDYAYTWNNGEGGIDEILANDFKPITKRLIYVNQANYSIENKIAYLELKCKDKNKYNELKTVLLKLLQAQELLQKEEYPKQLKKHKYKVNKTEFEFKVRNEFFIANLVDHYQKLSKLKEIRFN